MENEKIDRIVQLDIEVDGLSEEELQDFGVEIVSLVADPAIGVDFQYFADETVVNLDDLDDACQPGYKAIGLKPKGGRMVPNCVPIENELVELESYTCIKIRRREWMGQLWYTSWQTSCKSISKS